MQNATPLTLTTLLQNSKGLTQSLSQGSLKQNGVSSQFSTSADGFRSISDVAGSGEDFRSALERTVRDAREATGKTLHSLARNSRNGANASADNFQKMALPERSASQTFDNTASSYVRSDGAGQQAEVQDTGSRLTPGQESGSLTPSDEASTPEQLANARSFNAEGEISELDAEIIQANADVSVVEENMAAEETAQPVVAEDASNENAGPLVSKLFNVNLSALEETSGEEVTASEGVIRPGSEEEKEIGELAALYGILARSEYGVAAEQNGESLSPLEAAPAENEGNLLGNGLRQNRATSQIGESQGDDGQNSEENIALPYASALALQQLAEGGEVLSQDGIQNNGGDEDGLSQTAKENGQQAQDARQMKAQLESVEAQKDAKAALAENSKTDTGGKVNQDAVQGLRQAGQQSHQQSGGNASDQSGQGNGQQGGNPLLAQNSTALQGLPQGIDGVNGKPFDSYMKAMGQTARDMQQTQQQATRDSVLAQVKMGVAQMDGKTEKSISVQLYPKELGNVDIHMKIQADGKTHVMIAAEKAETLTLLQKESGNLKEILQDALKTGSSEMNFTFHQEGQGNFSNQDDNQFALGGFHNLSSAPELEEGIPMVPYYLSGQPLEHINITV